MPPASQYGCVNYWGTQVIAYDVDPRPRVALMITGGCLVDTQPPDGADDCSWDDVRMRRCRWPTNLSMPAHREPDAPLSEIADDLLEPIGPSRPPVASYDYTHRGAELHARGHPRPHLGGPGSCRRCGRVPGLRPPLPSLGQDGRAARAATCRATTTPKWTPPSARKSSPRAMRGSKCRRAGASASTRRTTAPSASVTSLGRGRDDSDVPPVKGIYAGNAENDMRSPFA